MKRTIGSVLVATVLALTAGCGGGGRPSADDVAKSFKDGKAADLMSLPKNLITDKAATCIGKVIAGSDLSDDAVRAIVDGDKDFRGDRDDAAALTKLASAMGDCAKEAAAP